jgi:hypothetical protein
MQGPFAPLTELAQKNLALWEQMQAATRDAFMGGGGAKTTERNDKKPNDGKKGK